MSRGGPDDQHRTRQPDTASSAQAHENTAGTALLDKVAADTGAVEKALVDQGFKNAVVSHGEKKMGIGVEVVERAIPRRPGSFPRPHL
ncbi:hypothetical protein [Streptomyces sp. NPDC054952]